MRLFIGYMAFFLFASCGHRRDITCKKQFYVCAQECSKICQATIKKDYEYGKCFTKCVNPCRADYCKEIRDK